VEVAKRGAKVIMACRSGIPEKGEAVKKLSGSGNIHMIQVDFSDIRSIHHLVDEVRNSFGKVDILFAMRGLSRRKQEDNPGIEEMFMVNYLSKFIFVNLMIRENCFRLDGTTIPYPVCFFRIPP